jgi:hypothetical protein
VTAYHSVVLILFACRFHYVCARDDCGLHERKRRIQWKQVLLRLRDFENLSQEVDDDDVCLFQVPIDGTLSV